MDTTSSDKKTAISKLTGKSKQPPALHTLFSNDPDRSSFFTFRAGDWTVDFSRQLVDRETLSLLLNIANMSRMREKISSMFGGERINETENRPALHTALRSPADSGITVNGQSVFKAVQTVLNKMTQFTEDILSGKKTGYTGKKFRHVVAIGIGGSNLGPEMASRALSDYSSGLDVRYVSNIDPTDISKTLSDLNPEDTLFIISSKKFTTSETIQNASVARDWCEKSLGSKAAVGSHFAAVSSNRELVEKFGIKAENMFELWDWVGGRFSMCSSIGLPIMLSVGSKNFMEMLKGFHKIDLHYLETPVENNVPVIMALVNFWNTTFLHFQAHTMVTYDECIALLPDHLQQLFMESLGKRVTMKGEKIDFTACPVVFGGIGTNIQHSYVQMMLQGSGITVPVDFIAFAESLHPVGDLHRDLFLNMVAQANVLAFGQSSEELQKLHISQNLIPHYEIPGNKPSSLLICNKLTPFSLGQLIGLFEHVVHAWSVLLNINAFDQFGVEAGKRTAQELKTRMEGRLDLDRALNLLRYPS
jgi:glucose-6-phosphate isomerase